MLKISDLKMRDVINIRDGRRLGFVGDLELDLEEGKVKAIIVPRRQSWFSIWGKDREYIIPWHDIVKIGVDIILVEIEEDIHNGKRQGKGQQKVNPWKRPPFFGDE